MSHEDSTMIGGRASEFTGVVVEHAGRVVVVGVSPVCRGVDHAGIDNDHTSLAVLPAYASRMISR